MAGEPGEIAALADRTLLRNFGSISDLERHGQLTRPLYEEPEKWTRKSSSSSLFLLNAAPRSSRRRRVVSAFKNGKLCGDLSLLGTTLMNGPKPEEPQLSGHTVGPHPISPLPTGGQGSGNPLGLTGFGVLSLEPQNLENDRLLFASPRIQVGGMTVPALGGIPLLAKVGQGGMGAVYFGVHPRLKQEVAVKILPLVTADQQPHLVDRFFREAQMAARVESSHLVRVSDVNEEHGMFFLVMEYVHGQTAGTYLRERLKMGQPGVSEFVALEICIAATEGLAAAHAKGIVHRDIKPDNILIPWKGDTLAFDAAKLADLGLARCEEVGRSLTGTQAMLGTAGYMAPEQAVDARKARKQADVFSMGATLQALLTGQPPFHGSSALETILATLQKPHVPVRNTCPSLSRITAELIEHCLRKDPAERFVDAAALLEALKVCRISLGEPEPTQHKAIEHLSLLKAAAEVGQRVPATDGEGGALHVSATPPSSSAAPLSLQGAFDAPAPATAKPVTGPTRQSRVKVAVLAVIMVCFAAAASFGFLRWRNTQFANARDDLLRDAASRQQTSGKELDEAIEALENFQRANASRPAGDLAELNASLVQLTSRRVWLAERRRQFDATLAEVTRQLMKDPALALAALQDAERLGRADEQMALPDLLATAVPGIVELRDQVNEAKKAAEQRAREAVDNAARQAFTQHLDSARAAARLADWKAVQDALAAAQKALGDRDHPEKAAAQALEEQARTELEVRGRFSPALKRAEDILEKDPEQAGRLLEDARKIWPESPEIPKFEAALAAAMTRLRDARFAAAMAAGRKALDEKRWTDARDAYQRALKEKDDINAVQGIADADYFDAIGRGESLLKTKEWAKAEAAFNEALKVLKTDRAAIEGIERAKSLARDEQYQSHMSRGAAALKHKDFAAAEEAFGKALETKPGDADAQQYQDTTRRKASDAQYEEAITAGNEALKDGDLLAAKAACRRALQERDKDAEALKLLARVEALARPKTPAPASNAPQEPRFAPPKTYGPFGVYASRIQGVPLDKNGELVPVRLDLDREQYDEALRARKTWLTVKQGAKVRIEASGKWYSGPTGAWVTADGKRDDGRESLKSFRALQGPNNSYNIAMLVVYISDKEKPQSADYERISNAQQGWAYKGEPLEFVMPVDGTLRMQQNRDGFFDVTQGALSVTVSISDRLDK
jgi:serine/threonine-protein kinase